MRAHPVVPLLPTMVSLLILTAQSLPGATFVQNPSFESNYSPDGAHYGSIDLWTGGSGVNQADGPFHNPSTQIPDQSRAAFIQGSASLRQTITGLIPGQPYCLQFFYDARNCCGGTVDLVTRFGGTQFDRIINVRPSPTVPNHNFYYFRNVAVTSAVDTAELEFATVTVGDATIVLDAVCLVPCDAGSVVVMNPSFEASGSIPVPGLIQAGQALAGWTIGAGGLVGINASGEGFADNGTPSDQDHVVFLQGISSISQELNGLIPGTNYEVSFAYNQRSFDLSHLLVTVGTTVLFDADVTDVGGANPYATFAGQFSAPEITATLTFEQTVPEQVVLIDDIHVRGSTRPPLPCLGISPTAVELAPGQTVTTTVTVPSELTAGKSAMVQFRSPNTNVAELINADQDGNLSLEFGVGETTKVFETRAVGRGTVRIEIVDSAGLCTENDLSVTVLTSFVRNASFESSGVPAGVGYGPIVAWETTGQTGLNGAGGPFHDNGLIPDRAQVAFIQGAGSLSQSIFGLTPGANYWLQFHDNARNCCGGTIDLRVRFGGVEIASIPAVAAVLAGDYHFQNINFVPTDSSGLLEFVTTASGDASLLLDAVSIVPRSPTDIVVMNPSFEGTGIPAGLGYIQPNRFAGWTPSGGGYGPNIDGVGPFTDNGDAPDQDIVAFIQGPVSISQNVSGLTVGQNYTLSFAVNARACCSPPPTHYTVTLAGAELVNEDVAPVGGSSPYVVRSLVFTAASTEGELRFSHVPPAGDFTLLLDDIRICAGDCRPSPRLRIQLGTTFASTVRLSWPGSYSGYILESTDDPMTGGWQEVIAPVQVEGDEFFVIDDTSGVARHFYRLHATP